MGDLAAAPRWAPRSSRDKIRLFYESAAEGLLDEKLLDDVGAALHQRCQSILTVTDAHMRGRFPCPSCGQVIQRKGGNDEVLSCEACLWSLPWQD